MRWPTFDLSYLHENSNVSHGNWMKMTARTQGKRRREKDGETRESGYDLFMKTTRFTYFLWSIIFCASGFSSWSCLNHACCSIGPYLSAPIRIFKNDEFWPNNGPCEKSGHIFNKGANIGLSARNFLRVSARNFPRIVFSWFFARSFVIFLTIFLTYANMKCQPIRLHNHLCL